MLVLGAISYGQRQLKSGAMVGSDAQQCIMWKDRDKSPPSVLLESPAGPKLVPGIARVLVRDLLARRFLYSRPDKPMALSKPIPGATFFESKNVRAMQDEVSFDYDFVFLNKRSTRHAALVLRDLDYVNCVSESQDGDRFFVIFAQSQKKDVVRAWFTALQSESLDVLAWKDAGDARRFADALNWLIYQAHQPGSDAAELSEFTARLQGWHEKPDRKPQLSEALERDRILAEEAVNNKEFVKALERYEDGIAVYPVWAEGWFNAALLYASLDEYGYAANRMRHYVLLMPEAADAKAAREKIIIWDDKAKNP
jgi:hypothetical protein